MGDSGDEVAALQQMLVETGFLFAEPDGMFGKQTEEAVKWFQEYAGLAPNGVVGDWEPNALYDKWLAASPEGNRTAIAASQAFFTL